MENPKTLISQIMSNMGALDYIRVLQTLEKAGGVKVAHKLGQEAYLQPESPPKPPTPPPISPPFPVPKTGFGTTGFGTITPGGAGLFSGAVAPQKPEKGMMFGQKPSPEKGKCFGYLEANPRRKIEFGSEGFSLGPWPEKRKSPEKQGGSEDKKVKTDELINQAGQLMKQLSELIAKVNE